MKNQYVRLSKYEIATYLKSYMELMISSINNRNISFADLFCKNMENIRMTRYVSSNYYQNMNLIYDFFLLSSYYGITNDLEQSYLEEVKIEQIDCFKNIFINKEDSKRFSKKQIIKYIRNAICHNDKIDKELYKLYKCNDEIFIEISLEKTKPIPFHVRLTLKDYISIMSQLCNSNHSIECGVLLPDEINYQNYTKYLDEISLVYIDHIKKETANVADECIISDAELNEEQKLKIKQEIPKWKINSKKYFKDLLEYIIRNAIPLGATKLDDIKYNLNILQYNVKDPTNSLNKTIQNIEKTNNKEIDFKEILNYNHFGKYVHYSFIIYLRYVIDTITTDDNININNVIYSRNKIRNSLVHGRWFFGPNDKLELYDSNEPYGYKFANNWHESISFEYLISFVLEEYNKLSNNKKNNIYYPISFKCDVEKGKILHISFIKNDKQYIYNLRLTPNKDNIIPWGLYVIDNKEFRFVIDPEEANEFFDEIINLSFEEKLKYSKIISELKSQYLKALRYQNKEISKEELYEKNYIISELNILETKNKIKKKSFKKF